MELRGRHLQSHQFFRVLSQVDKLTLEDICCTATFFSVFLAEDAVFVQGEEAEGASFIVHGTVRYTQEMMQRQSTEQEVGEASWLCWAALWTHWQHVGSAETISSAELLCLRADALLLVVCRHPRLKTFCTEYIDIMHQKITDSTAVLPSDVAVPSWEFPEVVCLMSQTSQVLAGMAALDAKVPRNWRGRRWKPVIEQLAAELVNGKCMVIETLEGDIQRLVAVTAVRIERSDKRILVCLAARSERGFSACVKLPGVKQVTTEHPTQALERLKRDFFSDFCLDFEMSFQGFERADYTQVSRRYRVPTRYLRTVFAAMVEGSGRRLDSAVVSPIGKSKTTRAECLLSHSDCFFLGTGEKQVLCAWLAPDALETTQARNYEKLVNKWMLENEIGQRTELEPRLSDRMRRSFHPRI